MVLTRAERTDVLLVLEKQAESAEIKRCRLAMTELAKKRIYWPLAISGRHGAVRTWSNADSSRGR